MDHPKEMPHASLIDTGLPATEGKAYMLDTNVFNAVLDGKMSLASFDDCRVLVIGVQADELRATRNAKRRADLLAAFEEVGPTTTLASSLCFGVEGAGFGQATWNDGSGTFGRMLARLQQLDAKKKREKEEINQIRDVLIAETAIKNGTILVTGDANLRQVVSEYSGHAIDIPSLLNGGGHTARVSNHLRAAAMPSILEVR